LRWFVRNAPGGQAETFLEQAVEVGGVGEAAAVGDFRDGDAEFVGSDKRQPGMLKAPFPKIVSETFAVLFK